MSGFFAKDINLFHFEMRDCSYPPKDIHTMALEVTVENIGALSLEFETELMYHAGMPFFPVSLARKPKGEDKEGSVRPRQIRLGDWLVVLWDEIHVFRDTEFKYTFRVDTPAPHTRMYNEDTPAESTRVDIPVEVAKSEPSSWLPKNDGDENKTSGFLNEYH
jgi:hypothetical protein